MYIVSSDISKKDNCDERIVDILEKVSEEYLRDSVEKISIPRHRFSESNNNRAVGEWILGQFKELGLTAFSQGEIGNIVGLPKGGFGCARMLIGAHYDSVPRSPGADDNASAVVGMLAAAKVLAEFENLPVAFVAFNQEEDGLLGSRDFVENYVSQEDNNLELVHILEMIGYCDKREGSQHLPPGLPIKISDIGDFIAILANKNSNKFVSSMIKAASNYTPDLPVKALKVFLGMEKFFPHLLRSDHSPFWSKNIPAFMWTDTSEFRNPNYHRPCDTPDTLDYDFLRKVVQLLCAHTIEHLQLAKECKV